MKYLEIRDFESINNALVFDADDCRILGKCELYTTKAAGADKKLCKTIENSLAAKYTDPTDMPAPRDASSGRRISRGTQPIARSRSAHPDPASNLSPSSASANMSKSPFGPLNQSASRKTFAYIVATLNASHPDHDFSALHPFDFRKERSLPLVINALNTTLSSQGRLIVTGLWEVIDRHIDLSQCDVYSYSPDADSDPHGGDGLLWSQSYFFNSKEQKRVLYFTIRGVSHKSPRMRARDRTSSGDYESDASDGLDGRSTYYPDELEDMEL